MSQESKSYSVVADLASFLVINKAANVDFHSSNNQAGIVAQVSHDRAGESLFPVHRLDKMTSGLLILAKSSEVAAQFGELFATRQIEKYYLAVSDKKPKKKQGLIKGDMKKGRNGSYLLLKSNDNSAVTQFFSYSIAPGIRGYVLKPHTGKTHQLRVAMKSIGAPILGDDRYYPNNQQLIGMLHAWQLSFKLADEFYHFTAEPSWENNGISNWLKEMTSIKQWNWPKL